MSALGHKRTLKHSNQCPLYPRKRTWFSTSGKSALCQKRTWSARRCVTLRANRPRLGLRNLRMVDPEGTFNPARVSRLIDTYSWAPPFSNLGLATSKSAKFDLPLAAAKWYSANRGE